MMKRHLILPLLLLYGAAFAITPDDTLALAPKEGYGKEARIMTWILDSNHYSKIHISDSLSSAILDAYIKELDDNKSYFLAEDIRSFEKYRFEIDDLTKNEDVTPAYVIYNVFRKRFEERMDYVMKNLIHENYDFTMDDVYEVDRDKEPWASTTEELNTLWYKALKNQTLSLKVSGKKLEEIPDLLEKRYERLGKNILQFRTDDVFGIYMNTIATSYDPHTNYFLPSEADVFKESISLSFEGIGARLQTENDYTKVTEVLPGGPAEKSKLLHAEDKIVGVGQGDDGEMVDVVGWRIDDVVKLIKGPKGTTVRLQLLPATAGVAGPTTEISLTRDRIDNKEQHAKKQIYEYRSGGKLYKLGVIDVPSFYLEYEAFQKGDPNYNSTTRDVKHFLDEMKNEKIDGIVLDLRDNGGGSLSEAISLTGLFIKNGPVVQVKDSQNRIEVESDDDSSITYSGPLMVLTNRFSASASEIFSAAIQDYNRGVIVGESTYGKGTVQTVVDLNRFLNDKNDKGGDLKLTFQKFYRISGSSTQHKGVTPDVALPSALAPEQLGESANPSALPWDEIRSSAYTKTPYITEKVKRDLNQLYEKRLASDKQLQEFVTTTEERKKNISQTSISLNEEKRKKEMKDNTEASGDDGLSTTIEGKGDKLNPPSENLDMKDEYLRETLILLSDLVNMKVG